MKSYLIIPAMAIFSAIALFVGSVVTVQAGHHGHSMFKANLNEMDSNEDGVVSFDEYDAFHSEQLRWSFDAIDLDNDGAISENEWNQFLKMHGVGKGYGSDKQS